MDLLLLLLHSENSGCAGSLKNFIDELKLRKRSKQGAAAKICHCEPVTDVTGVAIRSLGRDYDFSPPLGDADCHTSVRAGSQ